MKVGLKTTYLGTYLIMLVYLMCVPVLLRHKDLSELQSTDLWIHVMEFLT